MKSLLVIAGFVMVLPVRVPASSCTLTPAMPVSGQFVTITFNPAGGPLAGAGTIKIHRGINGWSPTAAPDETITNTSSAGGYTFSYTVPPEAYVLNCAFTDGAGTWDNNQGANWNFKVTPMAPPTPIPANGNLTGVMMEGFYWNCPSGWYNVMATNAASLRNMQGGYGIDRIWFPPPSKCQSGGASMGYDPYDYYDLGQYNQRGTTATHFGTQAQLKSAINAFHTNGIACLADLVLNHRAGGANEANPNLGGTNTATDFSKVASGLCTWHYNQFHPSTFEDCDESHFSSYADVCHVTGNTPGCAHSDLIQWAQWLMNTNNAGFDGGWRFDYAMGYYPSMVADLRSNTANAFGVGEYTWDTNVTNTDSFVTYSGGTCAFDFPGYFTMCPVFTNSGNIAALVDARKVYAVKNPAKAVTFVANHDTDTITQNKMLAYAFILTYQGYPCIFWHDYFENGLATLGGQAGNGINPLVWVRGALGGGQPSIQLLQTNDANLLVYGATNTPGYIAAINNSANSTKGATVTTANAFLRGKTLRCVAWYSYVNGQNTQPADVACSSNGVVTLQVAPSGYAVYSAASNVLAAPATLACAAGDAQVVLNWATTQGATSYHVKRSTTNGGPFTSIATPTSAAYTNSDLANGTLYYYVVSALNTNGESGDSIQSAARPVSLASPVLGWNWDEGQLHFNWAADHVGWRLELQTNSPGIGIGPKWYPASGSELTNLWSAQVYASSPGMFFRLVYP